MASEHRLSQDTIRKAVKALLKWKNSQTKTQNLQLLDEHDDFLYLVLTLRKIPSKDRTSPHKIPLPHPLLLRDPFSECCLIVDDRPKNSKIKSDEAQKKIKSEDIPISKILKFSKIKSDYGSFEAKRKLCDSYDVFFADNRVVPLLPKLLGKQFFRKKKKVPVPVDLRRSNWKEQIVRACSSALFFFSTGTCSVMRVGKLSMEIEAIVENVVAAIDGVVELVPKKWIGVRSFHLKFSESLSLPIYEAFPDMKLKIEGTKNTEIEGQKSEKVQKRNGELGSADLVGKKRRRNGDAHAMEGKGRVLRSKRKIDGFLALN